VRYLGDLHGGQVVARTVARALAASGHTAPLAAAFYDFGPPQRVLALRQGLRAALGGLVLQAGQQQAIVAEACWSFEQHALMFEQLQALEPLAAEPAPGAGAPGGPEPAAAAVGG
jgi:heme oxygenase